MFTVEQRDVLRERVLRLAAEDERVVAGALVGSLAVDGGDRLFAPRNERHCVYRRDP
jgi:hypothetical protein